MVAFFSTFESPRMRLMPRVEDTFGLYRNMLIGMVGLFQIPTLVFFLARLRVVTVFAAPMMALYVISIGVAWIVAPRRLDQSGPPETPHLKLVFAASVIEQASRRHRSRSRFRALGPE